MKMIITLIIIFMNIEQPVHTVNLPDREGSIPKSAVEDAVTKTTIDS
jgi:hypothetical protein